MMGRNRIKRAVIDLVIYLILLETGLRLGGFMFLSLQEFRNMRFLNEKGIYKILCIGDSNTQNQYPRYLEQFLNQRNQGLKFSVIDEGLPGTNSSITLDNLESSLNRYNPDMVVAMMGAADDVVHASYKTTPRAILFIQSLRTYKLIRLLWSYASTTARKIVSDQEYIFKKPESLCGNAGEANLFDDKKYVKLGQACFDRGKVREAEEYFKKALKVNPQNYTAYEELGGLYQDHGRFRDAERCFRKALEINPRADYTYFELGRLYMENGYPKEAEVCYDKALEINPSNEDAYVDLGWLYQNQGRFLESEELLKKSFAYSADRQARLSGALATLYGRKGEFMLMREYYGAAGKIRLRGYDSITVNNYQKLKSILSERNIQMVFSQYPMVSLAPLENIFQNNAEGIVFVDNENSFKEAVRKDGYKTYFLDVDGGDFGHCTDEGNRLLAENIAMVISKKIFGK